MCKQEQTGACRVPRHYHHVHEINKPYRQEGGREGERNPKTVKQEFKVPNIYVLPFTEDECLSSDVPQIFAELYLWTDQITALDKVKEGVTVQVVT